VPPTIQRFQLLLLALAVLAPVQTTEIINIIQSVNSNADSAWDRVWVMTTDNNLIAYLDFNLLRSRRWLQ